MRERFIGQVPTRSGSSPEEFADYMKSWKPPRPYWSSSPAPGPTDSSPISPHTAMHFVERYADFATRYRDTPITPGSCHHAKRAVIDWFALLPGRGLRPPPSLEAALADEFGAGPRAWPSAPAAGAPRPSSTAACPHGGSRRHLPQRHYHPGAPTIAAALALAQSRGATGDFSCAVIVGYEISTRIGAAMGRESTTATSTTPALSAAFGRRRGRRNPRWPTASPTRTGDRGHLRGRPAAGVPAWFAVKPPASRVARPRPAWLAATAAAEGVIGLLDVLGEGAGFGRALRHGHTRRRTGTPPSPRWAGLTSRK